MQERLGFLSSLGQFGETLIKLSDWFHVELIVWWRRNDAEMPKCNCWTFMKCGREPGGFAVNDLGICPAAVAIEHDSVNDGKNAGRFCWTVARTLCAGRPSGQFISKMTTCMNCEFYRMVVKEEGSNLTVKS